MKLKQYLKTQPRGQRLRMAETLGIHPMHLNNIIRQVRPPSLKLALKIEALTGGKVTPGDLMVAYTPPAKKVK